MASTQNDALPMPSSVAVRCAQVRRQSTAGDLLFTHLPDASLSPRQFTFSWARHGAVADAIRRHYEDHCLSTFTVTLPRTGEVVHVRWFGPPSIGWNSAVAASVTGEFEEVLAHE